MTAHDWDVIGEGANVDLFTETCVLGFGFQGMDLILSASCCAARLRRCCGKKPLSGAS
jgi:hypothetical protein